MSRRGQDEDVIRLWESGYALIGYASFSGSVIGTSADAALEQGKKIGAAVVVYYSKYQGTVTGSTTVPTTSTATTYSPSGRAYTTTIYGTSEIPYSMERYEFLAMYFAKTKDFTIGVLVRAPTGEEQQAFGTNKGLVVVAVRRGSSSYDAEVLPGDLILKIDGQTIDGPPMSLRPIFDAAAGREIVLSIRRKSGEITKRVMVRKI